MDHLDFAIRRYQQIVPDATRVIWNRATLRELGVWLTDDVSPIVELLANRPAFREQATWVLRSLCADASTPERQAIEAVDSALVECAKAQVQLLNKKRLRAQLVHRYPLQRHAVRGSIKTSTGNVKGKAQSKVIELGEVDVLDLEISQVGEIAKRCWHDLVNINDYFEPVQEFVEVEDGKRVQIGTLIVSMTPELHPVGNFVVRSMFRRIDGWLESLTAIHRKLFAALEASSVAYVGQKAESAHYEKLFGQHRILKRLLGSGEATQLRDACMTLTQILAAFHPTPDLAWLGLPTSLTDNAKNHLRPRITSLKNGEMFERIVWALIAVKRLYVDEPSDQSSLEAAIASGSLVIDWQQGVVHWERRPIDVDWGRHRKVWRLLNALAAKASHQAAVEERDVFGDEVASRSAMGTAASRLRNLLPPSLRKLIISGQTVRTYRLDLEPQRIYIRKVSTA